MTSDLIDHAVYAELKEATGAEFVMELVGAFLDEAPGMFADLRNALQIGDSDGFRRAAHSIKSNANTFGAHAFAAPARDLELIGRAEATPEAQALLARLDTEFERASDALKKLQNV